MMKRSIEQDIRNKNFGARNGNYEKNAVVKNQESKTACTKNSWRLLAMGDQRGQCIKGNNSSFRHDMKKRGKVTPVKSVSEFFHVAE